MIWRPTRSGPAGILGLAAFMLSTGPGSARLRAGGSGPRPEDVRARLARVASAVLRDDRPRELTTNWGEALLMAGMLRASRALGPRTPIAARARDAVRTWLDFHREAGVRFRLDAFPKGWPAHPELVINGYCGSWGPGLVALRLWRGTKRPEDLALARRIGRFILDRAGRTPDGGLEHWKGCGALWVDTLYYCVPLLAELGRTTGDARYLREAARQMLVHARHLQRTEAGLFVHDWSARTGKTPSIYWGRGNGWVAMALADLLEALPEDHPRRAEVLAVLRAMARGLLRHQTEAGMWRVVIERPDAPAETSGTAMLAYALARGARRGWLDRRCAGAALRAWRGLASRIAQDGVVGGVQAASDGRSFDHEVSRKVGRYPWGTGAVLLAGAEILALLEGAGSRGSEGGSL